MTDAIDPLDLRTFPPVQPLSQVPETWRQTLLSKYVECPRSAYLYLRYGGGALTHPLAGGTLLHRATERYLETLIRENERIGTPELAKDILNEVLAEATDLTVSPDRFDSLRSMIFHFAEGMAINPEKVVCLETDVSVEIGGHTITGRIDFAEADQYGLTIFDWKSAYHAVAQADADEDDEEYVPTKEEWPGSTQLVLYAYMLVHGETSHGQNFKELPEFRLKQVHPRQFWENEGTMAYREAVIKHETLLDWRLFLEAEVAKLDKALKTWQFPAILGSHCDYCPASAECPIPAPLREFRGELRTEEDAQRAAIRRDRHRRRGEELTSALRGYFKNAPKKRLRYGRDQELRLKQSESERIKPKVNWPPAERKKINGKVALRHAISQSEDIGIPVDWDYFMTKSVSTRLSRRTLTAQELAAGREHNREEQNDES